jgi:hypothetical protein
VAPEISIPTGHIYKDKCTNVLFQDTAIPVTLAGVKIKSSCRTVLEDMLNKMSHTVVWHQIIFLMNLKSQISDNVPSDIMEPVSYSESVFCTCGRRFSVVVKPGHFRNHGKNINKTIWGINIATGMDVKDAIYIHTNVLINVWASPKEEFPHIWSTAVKKLLQFPSAYLCKTAFSRCATTKMK